jgi:mRNA interferase RelE/StbE
VVWKISIDRRALKSLRSVGAQDRARIAAFIERRLSVIEDPRSIGEALAGKLSPFWKYRVGDYRLIARLEDAQVYILILQIGHRREIYRQ